VCLFKVTKDNDTVKNIFKGFIEVTNKLYYTDTLSNEEDREKWERSMSLFENSSKTVASRYTAAQRNPLQPLHNNRAKEYIRVPHNLTVKYPKMETLQFFSLS